MKHLTDKLRSAGQYIARNGTLLGLVLIVAVFAPNIITTDRASAAGVSSAGASDELRCSSAQYKTSSTQYYALSKCYANASFGSLAGTTRSAAVSSSGSLWYMTHTWGKIGTFTADTSSGATRSCGTSASNLQVFYGPQSTARWGTIPAYSLVALTTCASASSFNGNGWTDLDITGYMIYGCGTYSGTPEFAYTSDPTDTNRDARTCQQNAGFQSSAANADAIAWPPDWFPSGSGYVTITPFCGAVVTSTTHPSASAHIERGDSVTFSTSWTSTQTGNVDIMFPGGSWKSLYVPGAIPNPVVTTVTVDIPPSTTTSPIMSMARLRCYDASLATTLYLFFGDAVASNGDGRLRPCALARVYWPMNKQLAVSDVVTWDYSLSGLVTSAATSTSITSVQIATWDSSGSARIPPLTGMTWTTVAGPLALGSTGSWTGTAAYAAPTNQFVLRCNDSLGVYYAAQWTTGVRLTGSLPDPSTRDEGCFESTGLSVYPSSYIPGLVKMGSCLMKALFIPDPSTTSALLTAAQQFSTKAPFAYMVRGYTVTSSAMTGASASVTANNGTCLAITNVLPTGQTVGSTTSVCPTDSITSSTPITTFRTVIGYAAWLAFGFLTFRMGRRVVMGGSSAAA